MRVLLDTNVLISAFLGSGTCTRVFEACRANHTLLTATVIVTEFQEKLAKKFKLDARDVAAALAATVDRMEMIRDASDVEPYCRDPDDARVLAYAIAGECDVVITGDLDLLILREVHGVRIVSPREFLEIAAGGHGS